MVEHPVWEVKLSDTINTETILVAWSDEDEDGQWALTAGRMAHRYIRKKYPESPYEIVSIVQLNGVMPEELME